MSMLIKNVASENLSRPKQRTTGRQNPAHAGMNLKCTTLTVGEYAKPRSRGDEPYRFKNNGFNKYSIHAKMPIAGNEKMIGRLEAGDNA